MEENYKYLQFPGSRYPLAKPSYVAIIYPNCLLDVGARSTNYVIQITSANQVTVPYSLLFFLCLLSFLEKVDLYDFQKHDQYIFHNWRILNHIPDMLQNSFSTYTIMHSDIIQKVFSVRELSNSISSVIDHAVNARRPGTYLNTNMFRYYITSIGKGLSSSYYPALN